MNKWNMWIDPVILGILRLWERHHVFQNFFHRSLKRIGLTSSEERNGETLGLHELNPHGPWTNNMVHHMLGLENACSNQIDHGWVSILARSNLWPQTSTAKSRCTSDIRNASHFAPHLDCMVLMTVRWSIKIPRCQFGVGVGVIMTSSTWPSHSFKKFPRGPDGMAFF